MIRFKYIRLPPLQKNTPQLIQYYMYTIKYSLSLIFIDLLNYLLFYLNTFRTWTNLAFIRISLKLYWPSSDPYMNMDLLIRALHFYRIDDYWACADNFFKVCFLCCRYIAMSLALPAWLCIYYPCVKPAKPCRS